MLNEGGLFGERAGWHLPGFDASRWPRRALRDGLPGARAGAGFFVTTFALAIPRGFDVFMSFNFDGNANGTSAPYRALLFVNGWMMGRRVGNLGYVFLSSDRERGLMEWTAVVGRRRSSPYTKEY